ncbi:unnamed protein product [Clonostachys rosea f. rosea IK726]|uniref:Uncharacterized protein n=1 Tax=Clonostachys rosea f. rosea IK726 TaxID=1349383 RepID=A0ACA9UJ35_BIOOC|nr:unnamed protein product [Clonostachys rosea f. rosea IK726]
MDSPVPEANRVESLKQGYYQCSHCQRTFNRADHLQRHVRSRNLPWPVPSSYSIVLINARLATKDFVDSECMFQDLLSCSYGRGSILCPYANYSIETFLKDTPHAMNQMSRG